MKLNSLQLDAFFQTARMRSFSKAAKSLGITQSALSQRVAGLEEDLEVTLFIRDPHGPMLTTAGEFLLRHCQATDALEQEVLGHMKSSAQELRGQIRIAGFSSILCSVIIPSLAPFLRENRLVQCEFRSYEVVNLFNVLRNAEADLVVLDSHLERSGIREHILGKEEYVVIESEKYPTQENIYLDHGPHDQATEWFFRAQRSAPKNMRRTFVGDVYGIINGVELGLGRAVMSRHLLKSNKKVRIMKHYDRYFRDVTLNYFEQPFYSRLHHKVVEVLTKNAVQFLEG